MEKYRPRTKAQQAQFRYGQASARHMAARLALDKDNPTLEEFSFAADQIGLARKATKHADELIYHKPKIVFGSIEEIAHLLKYVNPAPTKNFRAEIEEE